MNIRYQEFLWANLEKYSAQANRIDFEDALCDYRRMKNVRSMPYGDLVHAYFCRVKGLPESQLVPGWKNPRAGLDDFVRDNPHIPSAEIADIFGVSAGVVRGIKAYQTMQRTADLERELASQQDEQWSQELDWEMYPDEYWDAVGEAPPEEVSYPYV